MSFTEPPLLIPFKDCLHFGQDMVEIKIAIGEGKRERRAEQCRAALTESNNKREHDEASSFPATNLNNLKLVTL